MNKTLSIPNEICEKLKNEENASALVSRLLRDYFLIPSTSNRIDLLKSLEEAKENINSIIEVKAKEIEKIEEKEKQIVEVVKTEEELENLAKDRTQQKIFNTIKNCKEIFDITISDFQVREYLMGDFKSLKEFLEEKGLVNSNGAKI